ncbi:o-succinylbenzoate--CoA ligase [Ornithinibacillus californiensis]|uniref:o-succinylbenzoate--CoA ligase n=1 Tax=Ornithinibacillus californiensis TaxID=161536 RepID=UPI00064DEF9A|nr:o-succinylbenzoate--CoA ligase [Ornithinibacillus californiensis]
MKPISYWIHKRAFLTPKRVALIGEESTYTYEALSEEVHRAASLLQHRFQLQKGDRVAILSQNRVEYMIFYFAIAQLGLVAVPLNVRLTASELQFQINDSGAKMILYESRTAALYEEIKNKVIFENAYCFGEKIDDYDLPCKEVNVNTADDPFIICYTSGTTGRPKGAVLTQDNMFWNALNNQYAIDITTNDKVIVLLPLFHIGGIGLFAFPTLLAGGTVVVPSKFEPGYAIQVIEEYEITIVMGVPTIHDAIRKHPRFETADFSSVRWFYSGGAPCPRELIEAYLDRGLPFGQGMGMTETSPTIFMLVKEDYQRKVGSIGKPVMFCDIAIVDEEGIPVPNGEVGELLIKGPHVMKEYWGLPDKTNEAIRDGWFYSGDLMRQDEEGFIYVAGRKKDMIISGGENIYPLEIEQVLKELSAINEAAVIGLPHEKWGEVPIAFISFNSNCDLSKEEIRDYCASKLAKYKVPKEFTILEDLPKNATGKIDKKALYMLLNAEVGKNEI